MFENIGPAEGASGCMQSGSSGRNRGRAAVEADAIGEQLIRQCKRRAHAAAEGDAIGGASGHNRGAAQRAVRRRITHGRRTRGK